jgi:hypothetical protein
MKTLLDVELPLLIEIVNIADRRERKLPEDEPGADLLRLAEIVVNLNHPRNARRMAALAWGAYRSGADVNRAGIVFGFVRFSRLMRAAACADLSTDQESIPAGFRM